MSAQILIGSVLLKMMDRVTCTTINIGMLINPKHSNYMQPFVFFCFIYWYMLLDYTDTVRYMRLKQK